MDVARRAALQLGGVALASVATTSGLTRAARAQVPGLKIGVLTDLSGPYSDDVGPMSVNCAKQAASEFTAATGIPVEVITGDPQLKPDIGAGIARQWFDRENVDAIVDMANSGVGLAVASICKEKNKVGLGSGVASIDLMRAQCNPNMVQWVFDSYTAGSVVPKAVVRDGGDTWFFIGADYIGSQQLMGFAVDSVKSSGGTVVGTVTHAFPGTGDFSAFLLQAQASEAKVLGLCNTSADLVNTLKQAQEFGLTSKMRLAVPLIFSTSVKAAGLDVTQNILLSTPFYWDLNDRTRAFSDRVKPRAPDKRPNDVQAGAYSAVLHYCKAAQAMGIVQAKADGAAAIARMKAMPTDDDVFGAGVVRTDGRKLHPSYVFRVKTPAESRSPWDLMSLVSSVPAEEAVFPPNAACSLWNGKPEWPPH